MTIIEHEEILHALERTGEAFIITDTGGIIEYVSPGIEALTGYQPEELHGKHTRIFKSDVDPQELYDQMWETILAKQLWSGVLHNKRKDGSVYLEKLTIKPITGDNGELRWFLATKSDIAFADSQQGNAGISLTNDIPKENILDIVTNLTGELQNSLQMILGFTRILSDDLDHKLTGDQREYFEIISRGTHRLLRMLDDTKLVSRLECDAVTFEPVSFNVAEELRNVIATIYPIHNAQHVRLIKVIEDAGAEIVADRHSFAMIITHLVINAMKFTKEGSITIGLQIQANQAVIWVIDTGVGISDQFKPSVFKSFKQEELGFLKEFEGAGLGLSITKKLVEHMGGMLSFESYKGNGTTFIASFPISGWEEGRDRPITVSPNGSH
ncbi:MAG: hypothetical protein CL946_08795 [Ectothiorhodospiraceae bacterium]|nr:hypothetical protein [Ectothiorhodospiraceae bacterium]